MNKEFQMKLLSLIERDSKLSEAEMPLGVCHGFDSFCTAGLQKIMRLQELQVHLSRKGPALCKP